VSAGPGSWAAILAQELNLGRLAAEPRRAGSPRIVATVCWSFPIWSQTFVHQELTAMIGAGFDLRLVYSHSEGREHLAPGHGALWRRRRRDWMHPVTARRDYERYRRRMPQRVGALLGALSEASGVPAGALSGHEHVLQAFSFTRIVEALRADYLHSYFFYERSLFALVAGWLLDLPRGVTCYADHLLHDYPLKVVALHLERCSLVVATSERIRRELLAMAPAADPARILVKPNAIDAEQFAPAPRPHGVGPFRIVSVSRIEPKKGLLELVDALAQLRAERRDAELTIVGAPDGSAAGSAYRDAVARRIAELGLTAAVRLAGRCDQPQIRRALQSAHAFVAPYVELASGDKDGIPTALLEAMASGAPIVATDAGSITEALTDGVTGLLVPQRDVGALAAALRRLADDPALAARLGAAAAAAVKLRYDVAVCETPLHDRIRQIIAARRRT